MKVAVLSIGDELVLGQTVDTNSAWISQQLTRRGVGTLLHLTVADELGAIRDAIHWAAKQVDGLIITGGLGPTDDDVTREALAAAMGGDLIEDADSVERIRGFFRQRGRVMPDRNRCQALHPRGSRVIPNDHGTAPGIVGEIDGAWFIVMPGVPTEMRQMFKAAVLPRITEAGGSGRTILTTTLHTFGKGESTIAEMLGDLTARDRNPLIGTTVSDGIVSIRIRSEADDLDAAESALETAITDVKQAVGPVLFGMDEQTLADVVHELLENSEQTIVTAESCTGGLVGKLLTDPPGASRTFAGGWVTYSNQMKVACVGVSLRELSEHGAVSESVAREMASGALLRSHADLAISTTGIAGPTGGSDGKPVGLVWVGLAGRVEQGEAVWTEAIRLHLPGDRAAVRDRTAKAALQLLRLHLLDVPLEELSWGETFDKMLHPPADLTANEGGGI